MVIPLSNANQPEQVILYQGGQMFDGAPRFHGRVGFTGTMPATNVSIFINNTQLSDTGTYQCLVNNLPDRGGRNIGVTGLTVLVPPSAPHCQIQGSQDIGSDVILLCSSEEGIPRPTYLWEKLDNTLKLPPTATQ
ncbi:IGSF11, partial [Cervus elaphus hippelaphus]